MSWPPDVAAVRPPLTSTRNHANAISAAAGEKGLANGLAERKRQRILTLKMIETRDVRLERKISDFHRTLTQNDKDDRHDDQLKYFADSSADIRTSAGLFARSAFSSQDYSRAEMHEDWSVALMFEKLLAREQASDYDIEVYKLKRRARATRAVVESLPTMTTLHAYDTEESEDLDTPRQLIDQSSRHDESPTPSRCVNRPQGPSSKSQLPPGSGNELRGFTLHLNRNTETETKKELFFGRWSNEDDAEKALHVMGMDEVPRTLDPHVRYLVEKLDTAVLRYRPDEVMLPMIEQTERCEHTMSYSAIVGSFADIYAGVHRWLMKTITQFALESNGYATCRRCLHDGRLCIRYLQDRFVVMPLPKTFRSTDTIEVGY